MNFEEIQRRTREVFRQEATDLLVELEAALLALETDVANDDAINRVFRSMHTLKGSGATSGFVELSDFVHHVEDVYNAAREGRLRLDSRMIDFTLKIVDAVTRYLDAPLADAAAVLAAAQGTLDSLLACLPARAGPVVAVADAVLSGPSGWLIRFQPALNFFQSGSDPAVFLDDLRALGSCVIRASTAALPALAELDPEQSYLAWEIELAAPVKESAIRDVFSFVVDDCELELVPKFQPSGSTSVGGARGRWLCEFNTTAPMLAAPGLMETLWLDLGRLGSHHVLLSPAIESGKNLPGFWRLQLETDAGSEEIDAGKAGAITDGREQHLSRPVGYYDSACRSRSARASDKRDLIEIVHRDAVVHPEKDGAGAGVSNRNQGGSSIGVPDSKLLIG